MTAPYRKPQGLPSAATCIVGDVFLPPVSHSAAFSRLVVVVGLLVLLCAPSLFGWPLSKDDLFGWFVIMVWCSVTLGPPLGALWDVVLARRGYRKRPAAVLGERLSYGVWGLQLGIEARDVSATRTMGGDMLLALQNDLPSIVFQPRQKCGDPPAWMTDREDKRGGNWSFVWRSRARVFLGFWGTVAWLGAVFTVMAMFKLWGDGYGFLLLVVPALVMAFVGIILLILRHSDLHRTAILTGYQGVWLLHVGSQSKRYVLPVEAENGLGTALLRVRIDDKEVLWEPIGGALTAERQAALISALAAGVRDRAAPATTTGGADGPKT